jgi:multimeric flavodoxin WrbA
MKKIVAFVGSPRPDGNTSKLVHEVIKGVREKEAEVNVYHLNQYNIKDCQCCFACKSGTTCVIKDDAKQILFDVAQADGVIFGTPVYMWDMTGNMKILIDRFYNYSGRLKPDKKVVWAATQGNPDENMFLPGFEKAGKLLQLLGFGEYRIIIAGGTRALNDVLKQEHKLDKARTLGRWLVE